jgi:glycosyl transferase family 25
MNLQILVISLKQSLERQEKVRQELSKTLLTWSFLDAVDGRKLSYPIPEYQAKKVKRLLGFELTPNEIGCFLSHKKAWHMCVEKNKPTLIFEDDFVLLPDFELVVNTLLEYLDQWSLVRLQALLSSSHHPIQSFDEFSLVMNEGDPLGATAYLVNPQAARELIQYAGQIYEPLDHYLEHQKKHHIPMLAIHPYPVDITKATSTIADRPNDRKPIKGIQKRMRSLYRQIDRVFSKDAWFPK